MDSDSSASGRRLLTATLHGVCRRASGHAAEDMHMSSVGILPAIWAASCRVAPEFPREPARHKQRILALQWGDQGSHSAHTRLQLKRSGPLPPADRASQLHASSQRPRRQNARRGGRCHNGRTRQVVYPDTTRGGILRIDCGHCD